MRVAYSNKEDDMRACVEEVVATYHPADNVNQEKKAVTA